MIVRWSEANGKEISGMYWDGVECKRYAVDVLMWWWLREDPRGDIPQMNKISLRRLSDLDLF